MRNLMTAALAGIVAVTMVLAATSGPEAGSNVQTIHIDAVNDDAGNYCVTCKAGQSPVVLAFVTKLDEPTQALIARVNENAEMYREQRLNAAVIFVGDEAGFAPVADWAKAHEIKVPLGRLAADSEDVRKWKINPEVSTTTVFIHQRKITASVVDIEAPKVCEHVGGICGA